jgi:hypothetical protein
MPPYPLPASPTLTNPDMILPDYEDPGSSPDRSQSPLMMWNSGQQQFDFNLPSFPAGPVTPATPIIYGNGTMLSDIGEVTEAESTTGPIKLRLASRSNGYTHRNAAAQPPPSAHSYEDTKKKRSEPRLLPRDRERRLSMESMDSTSTIMNGDHDGVFADFDDSVSVDDSVFQGDDEESMAESYMYDDAPAQTSRSLTGNHLQNGFNPTAEEQYSTALSRRAEQILANAKRRLTVSGALFFFLSLFCFARSVTFSHER